ICTPPFGGIDDHRRGEPAGGVHRLRAPACDGRVHQPNRGECGGEEAPQRRARETATNHLPDQGRNHEDEKDEAVAESLHRRPDPIGPTRIDGGRSSASFSDRPGCSSPPVTCVMLVTGAWYSSLRMPRIHTGAVI